MNAKSPQPFGRRGLVSNFGAQPVRASGTAPQLAQRNPSVSPELVAALLRSDADPSASATRGFQKVPRSFRAAILAGCIVAVFNAATNATFAAEANDTLGVLSFGSRNAPVIVALLLAALWSGARTSALILLVTHRLLVAIERTSYLSYAMFGGIVALGFGLFMQALGKPPGAGGIGMEILSGVGAGFFYRLFAGTQRQDV